MASAFSAGDKLGSFDAKLTQDLINEYARVSGDNNRVHLDAEFAKTTVFGGRVAHGMLGSNLIQGFLADKFGPAAIKSTQFKFRAPIKSGETAHFSAEVASAEGDFIQVKVECALDSGDVAIVCNATIKSNSRG